MSAGGLSNRAMSWSYYPVGYCAQLTGSADATTPSPTKTTKTGDGQGKPSAKAKPSKGPSNQPAAPDPRHVPPSLRGAVDLG
jgi:hypothetical protein